MASSLSENRNESVTSWPALGQALNKKRLRELGEVDVGLSAEFKDSELEES